MEWRMLKLLNKDRKRHSLKPVRMQEDLREVARAHSEDMAKKDYFDHVNLSAQSPADRLKMSGVTDVISGENLAKIGGHPNPTQFAETGLMNSPGHRANILNKTYNTVGIGVIESRDKIYYFTQNFAKRDIILKVFSRNYVSLKRGLTLKGSAFSNVREILYQVRRPMAEKVISEGKVKMNDRDFRFNIGFDSPGKYEIFLFVEHKEKNAYILSNSFHITVRRWWVL
ncbi:CAP domain-containing protein [Pseudomonadota bacterium]